jgi:diaminohydroxyphosphoribosylaminopyrimidine deaminase / 5-amino-6-(5-phosphoribosylamino)uracil reductase
MHEKMMKHALKCAEQGTGFVNPNPLVGAVVVKNNHIIAEGYHALYGSNHAEINAFNTAKESVEGATMYVTLEPCSHYGKTPPCAEAIIKNKIKEVFIASIDPNPLVAGKGVKLLENAGIRVSVGLLDNENKQLNKVFFKYIKSNTPYVVMKTAMSLDGKIGTNTGDSKWISNDKSRAFVHQLRHQYKAIMVGVNTVINDNPYLTTRLDNIKGRNPIRIIVDSNGKIPLDSNIVKTAESIKTIVATTKRCPNEVLERLHNKGIETIITTAQNNQVDLNELMQKLASIGIDGILLEGGSTLNAAALKAGIVDEIITFVAPKIISGKQALSPIGGEGINLMNEALNLKLMHYQLFDDDMMLQYIVVKENA